MDWRWWRKQTPGRVLRVRSRAESDQVSRIDLTDLVPPVADYLAWAAAGALTLSGEYARAGRQAWSAVDKDAIARANQVMLTRYEGIRALLADYSTDVTEALVVPLEHHSAQFGRMSGDRWFERVATCYVVGGFLLDFYRILATGLPGGLADRVGQILASREDEELLAGVLGRVLTLEPAYLSRVSLWSRRLVGDTMLIARAVLPRVNTVSSTGDRFEPLFTDVVTAHTRRLDRLGLTA